MRGYHYLVAAAVSWIFAPQRILLRRRCLSLYHSDSDYRKKPEVVATAIVSIIDDDDYKCDDVSTMSMLRRAAVSRRRRLCY
jgi:hypothetical protein